MALDNKKMKDGYFETALTNVKNDIEQSIKHVKYEHLVAGISGGVISTLALQPLDVIKIRFAVNDGKTHLLPKYNGIGNAFVTIFKKEGIYGLYRGVVPNIWGAGASWGLYFLFYNAIKEKIQATRLNESLGPNLHLLAAAEAGTLTLLLTNPIWVCKTRLCLQTTDKASRHYTGMFNTLMRIYKEEGVKGYYRGFLPGLFGVSHGAIQFMVYEELKSECNYYYNKPASSKLTTPQYLFFAALSKLVAVGATYPYQVVRLRLQNRFNPYSGATDCIRRTWVNEGFKGFYKGLGTNMIRVTPATMITFVTYEHVSQFLVKFGRVDSIKE